MARPSAPVTVRWTLALLALAVVLRTVQMAARSNLWFDELALALNVRERGFLELATQPLDHLQIAPLGFLLALEAATRVFGLSEVPLRIVPYLSALASVVLFWRVARRFVAGPGLLWGLLLLAVSPSLVYLAGTAKPYAGDVAATLLLVWLGLRHVERAPATRRALAAGALGALGIVLSNPAVPTAALVGAVLVAHHVRRRPRTSFAPLAAMLVPWGAAALFGAITAMQLSEPATEAYMARYWEQGFPPAGPEAASWLVRQLYEVVAHLLIFIVPSGGPLAVLVIVPLVPALWGVPALVRGDRWAAALALAPLLVAVTCAAADLLPLRTRIALYCAWPILLCAMVGIERAAQTARGATRAAALVLALVSAGTPAAAVLIKAPPPYRVEPFLPVLEEVVARRLPDDDVYVYHGARHAMDFYAPEVGIETWTQGSAHAVTLHGDPRVTLGGDPRVSLHADPRVSLRGELRATLRTTLREIDAFRGRPRVWFVYTHAIQRYGDLEPIRAYVETIGTVVDEVHDPYDLHDELTAGAWLLDLSNPTCLEAATADTFAPLPAVETAPLW